MSVDIGKVWTSLRTVLDPELGMSIVDLGLIYGVKITDSVVRVTMTLTTSGCPLHGAMKGWVREAVMLVPGVESVEVQLTFDPPWTPEWIKSLRR